MAVKSTLPVTKAYIPVNKLAEYMTANATRRRQIIKDLKADNDFMKVRYSEVRNILKTYFKNGCDVSKLESTLKRLEKKSAETHWEDNDCTNSILALKCLIDADMPDLSDYDVVDDIDKVDNILIGGLKVTVKPDVYLRNKYSNKIGGIKVHIAKTEKNQLDLEGMQYAATVIKCAFIEMGYRESEIDTNACISIDVFQKNFGTAPKAYKRILASLTAACEEILARWETI